MVAPKRHLARVRKDQGLLAIGRYGQLGRLDVKVHAWEKETGGVEKGTVGLTPVIDERVGKVPRRGMGEGQKRGLQVGEFAGVGLQEGNAFFRKAREDDAFDGAVRNAIFSHGADVFGQFFVVEIHERHSDPVAEGKRRLCEDVMPVSVAYQRENRSSIGVVKFFGDIPHCFVPRFIRRALHEACQREGQLPMGWRRGTVSQRKESKLRLIVNDCERSGLCVLAFSHQIFYGLLKLLTPQAKAARIQTQLAMFWIRRFSRRRHWQL